MTAPGVLYVVATPIGNLGDITQRALQTLREVDWIAAEDTRHSARLLQHYGIDTPLRSLHEHNERNRIPLVLSELQNGKSIALISDAGTPLISDPGFALLRSIREQGLRAVPIPGPSSVVAALSVAGLPSDRFVFEGFLPAKAGARRQRLEALATETRTVVLLESSHRILTALDAMIEVFGADRAAVIGRELTKMYEDIRGGSLEALQRELAAAPERCRGEFVVLVHGAPETESEDTRLQARRLLPVLLTELSPARAAAVVAKLTGMKKNTVYALALELSASAPPIDSQE